MNDPTRSRWNCRSPWSRVAIMVFLLGAATVAPARANSAPPDLVQTITASLAGRTGFAAQLLGSDMIIALNGDETFPMASAYKIAIAGKVLAMVDKGEVRLEQMVDIPPESYVPSPVIADNFNHPGVALSIANLIEVMIVHSDNTAADNLMALVGGPAAVTAWLREIGIEGMRVDRSTAEISAEIQGILEAAGSRGDPSNPAVPAFDADPRDHATPNEMLRLLILLADGNILKPGTRDFLLSVMGRTVTGPERIGGCFLPARRWLTRPGRLGASPMTWATSHCPMAPASPSRSSPAAAPRHQPTATAPSLRPPASSTISSRFSRANAPLRPTPRFRHDYPPYRLLLICNSQSGGSDG